MYTWNEILPEIQRAMGEKEDGTGRWGNAIYLQRANIIMHQIETSTLCIETLSTVTPTALTNEHSFPTGGQIITEVRYLGRPLYPTTLSKLLNQSRVGVIPNPWTAWADDEPQYWCVRADKYLIVPKVKVAVNNALTVLSRTISTSMTATDSKPYNDIEYMEGWEDLVIFGTIAWFLNQVGESKEGMREFANAQYTTRLPQLAGLIEKKLGIIQSPDVEKGK